MSKIIHKTLHYRSASVLPSLPFTLEDMLKSVLASHTLPAQRTQVLPGGVQLTLNDKATVGNTLCALCLKYLPGDHQLVVDQDPTAPIWKVHEIPPAALPGSTTMKRDFLPAVLYFGVRGNHLGVVQTTQFDADNLAEFLMWLFQKTPATTFAKNLMTFSPASAFALRQKGIDRAKAIKIKVPLAEEHTVPAAQKGGKKKSLIQKIIDPAKAAKITDALDALGIKAPASLLTGIDAKDLEIRLEIRRPYNRDALGNPAMNQLAKIMAANSSSEYTIIMPDDVEISGNTLKIHKDVEFTPVSGSKHPVPFEVFKSIDEYLKELIASGSV
jgi:hypothetical protein